MMDQASYVALFLTEAREHLTTLGDGLHRLATRPDDLEAVNGCFRAVHTLKGMAGMMGYTRTSRMAHALEQLLGEIRSGAVTVDAALVERMQAEAEALDDSAVDEAGRDSPDGLGEGAGSVQPVPRVPAAAPEPIGDERALRVIVYFDPAAQLPAARAVIALRHARELGRLEAVHPLEAELAEGVIDGPLAFELHTAASEDTVQRSIRSAGEVAEVEIEAVTPGEGFRRGATVRVDVAALDELAGRLAGVAGARTRIERSATRLDDPELRAAVAAAGAQIAAARAALVRLRTVPAREVLDRFPPLVREAARSLGKEVEVEIAGGDELLDRSLVNALGDLLVHLLRNAVDHGIEPPAERERVGKAAVGHIRLSAARTERGVAVRVEDDGRGLQRERILEFAVEHGVVEGERAAALSDAQVWELVTRPGFSTAATVTEVSGRGVGLDAVRARIRALGGALEIHSEAGRGAAFVLTVPAEPLPDGRRSPIVEPERPAPAAPGAIVR
ncbi:MAG TPA: Hpt domain-containing protein [Longimicrobiaceae bacterium]|nr:Hpt domain-containing protein [Longimicrobiaceae bacterium]